LGAEIATEANIGGEKCILAKTKLSNKLFVFIFYKDLIILGHAQTERIEID